MAHVLSEKDRTEDVLIEDTQGKTFEYFQLSEDLLKGLKTAGFERPSPIQLLAIPFGLAGLDLIVQSKSGTGKTCVYATITLSLIDSREPVLQAIVIAPTREIAVQGARTALEIGSSFPSLKVATFIGGMSVKEDRLKSKKCHIAFCTPGRLKQLITEGALRTDYVKLLILDEADKLFENNFREEVSWIMDKIPENRQTLALSATYQHKLESDLSLKMRNPTHVRLGQDCQVLLGVKQFVLECKFHSLPQKSVDIKFESLLSLLTSLSFEQCAVFCNYTLRARAICDKLNKLGWPAVFLAGMQSQSDRLQTLNDMRTFRCRIILTTDLAARGIDAKNLNFVVNFDVPLSSTVYLHRIGRAGRYGSKGVAVTLASFGSEIKELKAIARKTKSDIRVLDNEFEDIWDVSFSSFKMLWNPEKDTEEASQNITCEEESDNTSGESMLDNANSPGELTTFPFNKKPSVLPLQDIIRHLSLREDNFKELIKSIKYNTKDIDLLTITDSLLEGKTFANCAEDEKLLSDEEDKSLQGFPKKKHSSKKDSLFIAGKSKKKAKTLKKESRTGKESNENLQSAARKSFHSGCISGSAYDDWVNLWHQHIYQHQLFMDYYSNCQAINVNHCQYPAYSK